MKKLLVFMCIIASFFLNSCAAVGIIAGAGTLGCVAYEVHTEEHVGKERCPAIVAIDKGIEDVKSSKILLD